MAALSDEEERRVKRMMKTVMDLKSPSREDVVWLLDRVKPIFMKQPMLLEIDAPISICGDIHGQLSDLLRLFGQNGWPPSMRYLFLGDYVDRGPKNAETVCLMFGLKLKYPNDFFLLRGNHETRSTNRAYGFYDEVKKQYAGGAELYEKFNDVFDWMPLSALVAQRILCMHGGISPELSSLDQIRELPRPLLEVPDVGLVADILWSDPDKNVHGYAPSSRGISYTFGADAVADVCEALGLDMIARAHQVVHEGFEFFADEHLVTLFSAPDYCNQFTNAGGILSVEPDLNCKVKQIKSKTAS